MAQSRLLLCEALMSAADAMLNLFHVGLDALREHWNLPERRRNVFPAPPPPDVEQQVDSDLSGGTRVVEYLNSAAPSSSTVAAAAPQILYRFSSPAAMQRPVSGGFYAVVRGEAPGIYDDWDVCEPLVTGYPKAKYRKFATLAEAEAYYVRESSRRPQ